MNGSPVCFAEPHERVGKAPVESGQRRAVALAPLGQRTREQAAPRLRDRLNSLAAFGGQLRRVPAAVGVVCAPRNQGKALQLGELAADSGVVAPGMVGELRHAERPQGAKPHQQRKQGAVETYARFLQQRVVALRAVEKAEQIDQGGAEHVDILCILHLYGPSPESYVMCMIHASRTLVIIGSTRARRLCPQIAAWVAEVGRETLSGDIEIVDLKDWPLPMDDEPGVPALGDYAFEHTRAWSQKIAGAQAFVFVTPQYNWGYPAPLKNALDHLHAEWAGKPAMIVTYGGHGGSKCARQLRQVLKGLKMKPIAAMPGLTLAHERIKANTGSIDPAKEFARHRGALQRSFGQLAATNTSRRRWHWPW